MRQSLIFFLTLATLLASAQKRKNIFPVWTYHQRNINIHGVSVGIGSVRGEPRYTNTNGVKVELIGVGVGFPLIPESPVSQNDSSFVQLMADPISERMNGLNLSLSGTACDCVTNGISAGFVGQYNVRINGVSASAFMNFAQVHNGIQAALVFNESYRFRGLQVGAVNTGHYVSGIQIGVSNKSKNLKGIQVGLWNVNEKRKLPFINWDFRS